jgi:hypothetical protein
MSAGEGSLILNHAPDLLVGQDRTESDHARAGRAVLDDPENFAFGTVAPESMVLEIARRRIEFRRCGSLAAPIGAMTVETGTFAVIERLAFFDNLRGTRPGALERALQPVYRLALSAASSCAVPQRPQEPQSTSR